MSLRDSGLLSTLAPHCPPEGHGAAQVSNLLNVGDCLVVKEHLLAITIITHML